MEVFPNGPSCKDCHDGYCYSGIERLALPETQPYHQVVEGKDDYADKDEEQLFPHHPEKGKSREKLQGAQLILSAHTEMELVREALIELHYKIIAEQIALAAGRFYVVLSAAPGEERLSEKQLFLGPRLMEGRETNYLSYLQKRILRYQPMRDEQTIKELQWLKEEENRVRNCEND